VSSSREQFPDGSSIRYTHARQLTFGPIEVQSPASGGYSLVHNPIITTKWREPKYYSIRLRLDPKGGETTAILVDADGNEIERAIAVCSRKEHYNKKIGREIARGRLIKRLTLQGKWPRVADPVRERRARRRAARRLAAGSKDSQ
jgi:hypothetical protein